MLNILRNGQDDFSFMQIAEEAKQECFDLFKEAAEQEKNGLNTYSKMVQ